MRVYLAYLKDGVMDGSDYLYGYTNKEDIFNMFKNSRCEKAFRYKSVKLSKTEYNELSTKFSSKLIELSLIYTREVDEDGSITVKKVRVPLTSSEYDNVSVFKMNIFQDVLSALIDDDFDNLMKHAKCNMKSRISKILNVDYKLSDILQIYTTPIDEINDDEFTIDELGLFIRLYRFTLIEESAERRRKHFESLEDLQ